MKLNKTVLISIVVGILLTVTVLSVGSTFFLWKGQLRNTQNLNGIINLINQAQKK